MNIAFREASGADAKELTDIAFAAKRHWGYPEQWIELWARDLTVDSGYINANRVILAEAHSRILGWCAVSEEQGGHWLDHCWVLPEAAGSGIGRALVLEALRYVKTLHSSGLKVISDPHAEGFYRNLGFRLIGDHPSQPEGRRLPVLRASLADDA